MKRVRPMRDTSPNGDGRWSLVTDGVVAVMIGFVLFGIGVGDGLVVLRILGALAIVGGAAVVLFALVGPNYKG